METTLHRELKRLYAGDPDANEVTVDGYRIDAVAEGRLIEIQCASLAAIRDKIGVLCGGYDVTVVKPVAVRKYLVKRKRKGGPVLSARYGPKGESIFGVFEELVHFTRAFPHPRLQLEVLLLEIEEERVPARRRWNRGNHRVIDRRLRAIRERRRFGSPDDFDALFPPSLPSPFTTADVAQHADVPRWLAQKAAYFLREIGAWTVVGKRGNAMLYERGKRSAAAA